MVIYFFDWIATLTGCLIIADLFFVIITYFSGPTPIGTTAYFIGLMIFRTGISIPAWVGYWMLGKVHKEAIAREGLETKY